MQKKMNATKTVAVAVAFTMALSLATGIEADAAKKAPKLNKSSLTLNVGETAKLKVVKNKNKISKITWKSTKAAVASVKKGVVTAEAAGRATVKATFKVKGDKKKTTLKCKVTVNEAEEILAGGWTMAENPTVTDELKALVTEFAATANGMKVTPYALLATQVVAGTGYRVLCRVDFDKDAAGNEQSSFSILQLYADLSGALVKDSSKVIAYTDRFVSSLVGATAETPAVGGFTQFDDPVIPEKAKAEFLQYFKDKNIPFPYKPIARLAQRLSTGTREVSIVCEKELTSSGNVGTDEKVGYFIIKMTLDENDKHTGVTPLFFPISFTATDYSVCVKDLPAVDVETQAAWIRSYFIGAYEGNTEYLTKLAENISYPVTVDGTKVASQTEFAALLATKKIS